MQNGTSIGLLLALTYTEPRAAGSTVRIGNPIGLLLALTYNLYYQYGKPIELASDDIGIELTSNESNINVE